MGKFIVKALIFIGVVLSSIYFLPRVFEDKLEPLVLNKVTSGNPTYEVSNYKDFYNSIKSSVKNFEPSINIVFKDNYLNKDRNKIISYANDLIRTLGPGSYIRKYSITQKKSSLYEFYTITYNYEKSLNEIKTQSKRVDEIIKKTVKKITSSSMNDFEKEKAIHDFIVKNTRYDSENFKKNTTPIESHTAYGVLVRKTAVCEGYAIAMKKMLDEAHIDSLIVIGKADGSDHAWNMVKLGNQWYHVDPTWDDPVYTVNGKLVDILSYDYFNLTDKKIRKTHTWENKNYPTANGKNYRNPNKTN